VSAGWKFWPLIDSSDRKIKKIIHTGKPVFGDCNPRYGAFMETLIFKISDCKPEDGIRIQAANNCDGSICHQPIFREDGSLNFVPPHSHLVTQGIEGERYHMVLCDFPVEELAEERMVLERNTNDPAEQAFAEYLSSALAEYLASEKGR
jgi:hypothetical protein